MAAVITSFFVVAAQRLDTVPVPETDEAYTLQVAYEILNHGQLSLPMYRYLGGNIENVWHSYTPVYFVMLSGFLKLTNWGLLQGHIFNLITAGLLLIVVAVLARSLFDWRVGLLAVLLLVVDQMFFERSRLLRNDFAAAAMAMFAYYLYELASEKRKTGWYFASGLAAGAAVMCHTNALYLLVGIFLLMLFEEGWRRGLKSKHTYAFLLPALAVMSYEIVYDLIDYQNFLLQNRGDRLHFGILQNMGWWHNILNEASRYARWHTGGSLLSSGTRFGFRVFEVLAFLSILYLAIGFIRRIRDSAMQHRESRILFMTVVVIVFHAVITSHKNIYYMAHLSPWFALCAGVGVTALIDRGFELAEKRSSTRRLFAARLAFIAIALFFCVALVAQYRRYLREITSPHHASFEELRTVLRDLLPEGVCPVAIKSPEMWLAFPEYDRCFASIEQRMIDPVVLKGQEYALLLPSANHDKRLNRLMSLNARFSLLGDLKDTPYGRIRIYYTGSKPELIAKPPSRYYFFGKQRGVVTDGNINDSPEVWSVHISPDRSSVLEPQKGYSTSLEPETWYALSTEFESDGEYVHWFPDVVAFDPEGGSELGRIALRRENETPARTVFRSTSKGLVEIRLRTPRHSEQFADLPLTRIAIRRIQ